MKKLVKNTILAIGVAVLVLGGVSCNRNKKAAADSESNEKFKIEKVENFRMAGLTSCEIDVLVTNSTRHVFGLEECTIDILFGGAKLGAIVLDESVEVPKRATSSVTLPLSLSIENPIAIYGALGKIQRGETDKITLSLRAEVKGAGARRTIERRNIPLKDVLSMLGVDASGLQNILKF